MPSWRASGSPEGSTGREEAQGEMRTTRIRLTWFLTAGLLCPKLSPFAQEEGARFQCPLNDAGKLSAAVYDGSGRLVRTLHYLREKGSGSAEVSWDGLGNFGEPLSPGRYLVRAAVSNVRVKYVMTIGNGLQPSDPSDHGGVHAGQGVCVDPRGNVWFVGLIGGETPKNLQCYTPDGKRVRHFEPVFGGYAVAADDRFVYVLSHSRLEGQSLAFVYRFDAETGKQVEYAGRSAGRLNPGGVAPFPDPAALNDAVPRASSLALHAGKLYIAIPASQSMAVMDAKTGEVEATLSVPGLHAVAAGEDGTLYALVGNDMIAMDLQSNSQKVVARGLNNPGALAVGPDGSVFVLQDPAGVVKLSPSGKELLCVGERGSFYTPEDGKVKPTRFLSPTSIAVDKQGDFYLTDPGLSRVQKFRRDGTPVWSEVAIYAEEMCVDQEKPAELYCTNGGMELRRYLLNYKKPGWKLDAVWRVKMAPGKFMTVGMRIARIAGKRLLAVWDGGFFSVNGYRLLPLKVSPLPIIDEKGSALVVEAEAVYRQPAAFDHAGCPVYRSEDKRLVAALDLSWNAAHRVAFPNNYHLPRAVSDETGSFYIMAGEEGKSEGVGYWQRMYRQVYLQKYDTRGRLVWNLGRHAEAWANPGEFYMPNRVNVNRGFAYVTDVSGLLSIFDPNGLMVGFEIKDAYRGYSLANDLYGGGGESWVSYVFTHPESRKTYYLIQDHGLGAFRLYEVQGLEKVRTWASEITLTKPAPPKPRETEKKARLFSAQIFQARRTPMIDGDLSEWSETGAERLWMKEGDESLPNASLRFRYDSAYLYIAVHVRNDESPAVNAFAAERDLMWRADALELYLGTDFKAWRQRAYTANDYQFMFPVGPKASGKGYCWTRHEWVEGTQSAYGIDPDRKGYALEARLPWSYVRYEPKAGDKLPFDMRVMFGDAEGAQLMTNLIWCATNMAFNDTSEWGMALLQGFYAEQ